MILAAVGCMVAGVWAQDGPPQARVNAVTDELHGHKIVDPYRWLEDGDSAETKKFVSDELAYTRSVLDALPGRAQIDARLTQLAETGSIGVVQVGGDYYFHTRRRGMQNQPVLYVRESAQESDRVLVDVNALAADGTVALDWWQPSHDGKFVAYGTSPSGSEMSTLHVIETATGKMLPDVIDRSRAASVAWKLDDSGFYYTRYPKKGEVAEGQELYNRHVFYHALASDAAKDPLIFGKGRDPEDWPNVSLSDDGQWLLIQVSQGWTKSELYLADLENGGEPLRITSGKNFLYGGEVFEGNLYIHTNEDAPRYRVMKASVEEPQREHWAEIIPQDGEAVLEGVGLIGGTLVANYELNATSQMKIFATDGRLMEKVPLPGIGSVNGIGGNWDSREMFLLFESFTVPPGVY
ncbi:MAG: S9 family peptidase, partial [Acidobacteriales bacterium]|nr:S9 family peptidase [Terriglobales bacterium]